MNETSQPVNQARARGARRSVGRIAADAVLAVVSVGAFGLVLFAVIGALGLYGVLADPWPDRLNLALPWVMLLVMGIAAWRPFARPMMLVVATASGAFLVYLAWDEAEPPAIPPPPSVGSPESEAFRTYCWMLKDDPRNRLAEFPKLEYQPLVPPAEPAKWAAHAEENRAAIMAAWEQNELGRSWIEGLARISPQGVVLAVDVRGPLLAFMPVRQTLYLHWARAQLLYNDGRPDEAARMILQVLRATYHLQLAGTTLVNQMIPSVMARGSYERLERFSSQPLAPETRKEIIDVLGTAPPVADNIARAVMGEHVVARAAVLKLRDARQPDDEFWNPVPRGLLGRLLYNPNRTARQHAEFMNVMGRLAQQRRFGDEAQAAEAEYERASARHLKNAAGRQLLAMLPVLYDKVLLQFWNVDDQRLALIGKIQEI